METLYFNTALYSLYTLYGFYQCRRLTVHNALSLWFLFISLMGCISVECGYYQAIYDTVHDIPKLPYILCFISFVFLMLPLKKLNNKNIEFRGFPDGNNLIAFKYMLIPFAFFFIYTIIYIPSSLQALSVDDMSETYKSQRIDGVDLYHYSQIELLFISIGQKVFNCCFGVVLFYSLVLFNKKRGFVYKQHKKILLLMIICATFPIFLRTISSGGRGAFIFFSAQILFLILPLWYNFSSQLRKKLKIFGLCFICLGLLYSIAMTISRLSDSQHETPFTSVIRYFGEPFPNLGHVLWGKVSNYLMGRRMFSELFGYTYSDTMTQYDFFSLFEFYCGVPVLNYKTIYGDLYLEFGPVWALLIICTMGVLMNLYLKKNILYFYELPLYTYYITICTTAPLWFAQRNLGNILVIFECLILSYFIRKVLNKDTKIL